MSLLTSLTAVKNVFSIQPIQNNEAKMGSYAMNYNWHKKFAKSSKVNYNELYLLGLAEKNKRKKELEQQKKVNKFQDFLYNFIRPISTIFRG